MVFWSEQFCFSGRQDDFLPVLIDQVLDLLIDEVTGNWQITAGVPLREEAAEIFNRTIV